MCGIAGLASIREGVGPEIVKTMVETITHRGPDDVDIAVFDSIVLGTARLAILDQSPTGRQPMIHQSGRWAIVFNGEIYNHLDLRTCLPPYEYKGTSDTETLLHAIATWGVDGINRCNGIFAFAAVDLANQKLYLGRDRLGVKPLYFFCDGVRVLFASEIKALLAAGVPRNARIEVLTYILAQYWANGKDTPITGIDRVLPGTIVCININTLTISEDIWYEPSVSVRQELAQYLASLSDRSTVASLVEEALQTAVRYRTLSDAPIGLLCSGGLDSSLLSAYIASDYPDTPAYNVSIGGQAAYDEAPWAKEVCDFLGIQLHTVKVTAKTWREHFVRAVYHYEYPMVHESAVALAILAERAYRDGVRVLITGEGADELFGGYDSRHLDERSLFSAVSGLPLQPEIIYNIANRPTRNAALLALLEVPHLPRVQDYEDHARQSLKEAYAHHEPTRRELEAAIGSDIRNFLSHGLNRLDKNMMQSAVEVREPFLDHNIIELAMNLPLEMRILPRLKGILLDLGYNRLPRGIVDRPKMGFSFDPAVYLASARENELLNGLLREALAIDQRRWQRIIKYSSGRTIFRIWSAEVWCRTFLDNQSISFVESKIWNN